MKFKILGSGGSVGVPLAGCRCAVCTSSDPRDKRFRTSALLTTPRGNSILIDTSSDFRSQALTHDVRRIDAVLFTHSDADHILGFDDLRAFNFVQKTQIAGYATAETRREIERFFQYAFGKDSSRGEKFVPKVAFHEFDFSAPFVVEDVTIQPIRLLHGSMTVAGFRIGDLVYATDCNSIPDESRALMQGAKYLILDALRERPHPTHFTIEQAVEMSASLGAQKTYFIHFSHDVSHAAVSKKLPQGIELAYDGLELDF